MTRTQILEAVQKATELFQEHSEDSETSFDLIAVADKLDIPVLFRPLDNLLGGAVTFEGKRGILIQANLPRHLQRFTLAHEIGHIVLGHENQFDNEVGLSQRAIQRGNRPIEEIAADTFASELLAPIELVRKNAERQGWPRENLQDPEYIYQLSLRLGLSFKATCWALVEHDLLSRHTANEFTSQSDIVKQTKSMFIPDSVSRNPWADVWFLTEGDEGIQLIASEEDIFIIELEEKSSSGYRWDFPGSDEEVEIVHEGTKIGEKYGSTSSRTVGFKFASPGIHSITIKHKRPWNDDVIEKIKFSIDNRGGEKGGLPRQVKQNSLRRAEA